MNARHLFECEAISFIKKLESFLSGNYKTSIVFESVDDPHASFVFTDLEIDQIKETLDTIKKDQ